MVWILIRKVGTFPQADKTRVLRWTMVCAPEKAMGTPLQYSCLENPMDGGAWWAAVHGVAKSRTRLSDFPFTFHFHALEEEMATHSSVLAWRIPGTAEPDGLPSMESHRVGRDWSDLADGLCPGASGFLHPGTADKRAIQSMEFSRTEGWSGSPFPSPTEMVAEGKGMQIEERKMEMSISCGPKTNYLDKNCRFSH